MGMSFYNEIKLLTWEGEKMISWRVYCGQTLNMCVRNQSTTQQERRVRSKTIKWPSPWGRLTAPPSLEATICVYLVGHYKVWSIFVFLNRVAYWIVFPGMWTALTQKVLHILVHTGIESWGSFNRIMF